MLDQFYGSIYYQSQIDEMNIAVIFDKEIQSGGGYQYGLSIILLLNRNKSESYNFIFFTTKKENRVILKKYGIDCLYLHRKFIEKGN